MKNAILLHGTGDRRNSYWFPSTKKFLESCGYDVWLPQMPNAAKPNLDDWLPPVLQKCSFSNETVIIGHSAGAQLALSILEHIDVVVKQVVCVSGFAIPLPAHAGGKSKATFKWEQIRGNCRSFTFINSDNDPWGCDDAQGRIMLDHLGGILVVPKGEGHMGSTTYRQPYKTFPLLWKLLEK